jgi:hypothetical protein
MRRTALLVMMLGTTPALARAQVSLVGPGAEIRVTAPALGLAKARGTLMALQGDTIVFRQTAGGNVHRVDASQIERLERLAGQHANIAGGVKYGTIIGTVAGLGLGIASAASCGSNDWFCGPEDVPQGALAGAILGVLTGLVVGAVSHVDDWQQIWLTPSDRPVQPRISAWPGGIGVGLAIAF